MTQIGNHDDAYRSTPLEQKLAWFQNAPGLSAVEPARQFMTGAAALYTDSDAQVRATMRNLGADWTGEAATNAGATLQRAAQWSQDASAGHTVGGETVEGYGRSFESVRGQIHWDDPWAWGWNDTATAAASVATLNPAPFLGNLTADYFTTAQQNRTNDTTAIAALQTHEKQTRRAVDTFPSIDAKPQVGPNPSQPGVGGSLFTPPVTTAGTIDGASAGGGAGAGAIPAGGGIPGSVVAGGTGAGDVGGGGVGPGAVGAGGLAAGSLAAGGLAAGGLAAGGLAAGGLAAGGLAAGGLAAGGLAAGAVRPGGKAGGSGPTGSGAGAGGSGSASRAGSGGAIPGRTAVGADGLRGEPGRGTRPGGPAGEVATVEPRLRGGVDATSGVNGRDGGWREVVGRSPSEPGLISRGPAAGPEFAARLPAGAAIGGAATEGAGMPFMGGMGVGAAAQATEHRTTYWVRSAEPFDVPLPPHSEGVICGGGA